MKCARCQRSGSSASMRKILGGGWACRDDRKCVAEAVAKWTTPSKRAEWKRKGRTP